MSTKTNSTESDSETVRCTNRRRFLKATAAAGATATVLPNVTYTTRATESGSPELTTDGKIPSNTSVTVTGYEDVDGDDAAENQQSITLDDGTNTYVIDGFEGTGDTSYTYWWDIELSGDGQSTPQLSSLSLALPSTSDGSGTSDTSTDSTDETSEDSSWFDRVNPFADAGFSPLSSDDEEETDEGGLLDRINPFNEDGFSPLASDENEDDESFWDKINPFSDDGENDSFWDWFA